jgi:nascent polypeptide-associated complex subunit alpha
MYEVLKMMGGMNPRQMQGMMKKMGIRQVDIDAEEVIIVTADKRIRIMNPSVVKVNMMGQESYQISGQEVEEDLISGESDEVVEIADEDVQTVVSQTGVSEEDARAALEESNGDLASAIIKLQK